MRVSEIRLSFFTKILRDHPFARVCFPHDDDIDKMKQAVESHGRPFQIIFLPLFGGYISVKVSVVLCKISYTMRLPVQQICDLCKG
jgi:phenolic acid decarboxylase